MKTKRETQTAMETEAIRTEAIGTEAIGTTTTRTAAIEIVTIGVYGFDADQFFQALVDHKVDTLCDIRRRRGVRGAEYAFANKGRLQERLAALSIRYLHFLDLAPSTALREKQKTADKHGRTPPRKRTVLSTQFVQGYEQSVLVDCQS